MRLWRLMKLMEDDKVADMALKIPNEDFTDGTVVIDGTISKWR